MSIAKRPIDDVLSSLRILWPENILPQRHLSQLEQILLRLTRGPDAEAPSDADWWEKKGEKLVQFMQSIRGELATHLRQFNSKITVNSAPTFI